MTERIDSSTGEVLSDDDDGGYNALPTRAADGGPVAKRSGHVSDILRMLEDGQFNADVSVDMRELAKAMEAHAHNNKGVAKGKLTLELDFSLANGVFVITPSHKVKAPVHKRMKPKATAITAEERLHVEFVRSLGCLICGKAAEAHHIMHAPGKSKRRDHRFVVPLCHIHHRSKVGVHGLGSEAAFRDFWGVDLVGWCMAAWSHRNTLEAPFWQDSVTRWREVAMRKLSAMERAGRERDVWTTTRFDRP